MKSALSVYKCLASYTKSGSEIPLDVLSKKTGISSRTTLSKYIKLLVSAGCIAVERKVGSVNSYILLVDDIKTVRAQISKSGKSNSTSTWEPQKERKSFSGANVSAKALEYLHSSLKNGSKITKEFSIILELVEFVEDLQKKLSVYENTLDAMKVNDGHDMRTSTVKIKGDVAINNTSSDSFREDCFVKFWNKYNYKKGKVKARKVFMEITNFSEDLFEEIMEGVDIEISEREFGKIPKYPENWLSGRRWEDEEVCLF